jgi:23S rRNA (cytidine1920-2'-O)/16S rRNA (cytidine1409-2'-O)-methyltransferase
MILSALCLLPSALYNLSMPFVSRGGKKLDHALDVFGLDVSSFVCADLGCSTGGFVDCLLQRHAARVYAVDTAYGALDWKLRKDNRVIVMERVNAMHVQLPELIDLATIDVGWTKQKHILPAARKLLKPEGRVITLLKPHYEANPSRLRRGVLPAGEVEEIVQAVSVDVRGAGFEILQTTPSPLLGSGGNAEVLALLQSA